MKLPFRNAAFVLILGYFCRFLLLYFALLLAPGVFVETPSVGVGGGSVRSSIEFFPFLNKHFLANSSVLANTILGELTPAVVAVDKTASTAVLIRQLVVLTGSDTSLGWNIIVADSARWLVCLLHPRFFHLLVGGLLLLPGRFLELRFVLDLLDGFGWQARLHGRIAYKRLRLERVITVDSVFEAGLALLSRHILNRLLVELTGGLLSAFGLVLLALLLLNPPVFVRVKCLSVVLIAT